MGFLRAYMYNPADVEDVSQETWEYVHRYCEQFDPQYRFVNWLYMIATQRAGHSYRAQLRTYPLMEVGTRNSHLDLYINLLPERQRRVIVGLYYEGYTTREMGDIMGTHNVAVNRVKGTAITALRDLLT